jgi:hypothetical protein
MLALSAAPSVSYYQTLLFVLSQPCTKSERKHTDLRLLTQTGPSATQPAVRRCINYCDSIIEHSSNAAWVSLAESNFG